MNGNTASAALRFCPALAVNLEPLPSAVFVSISDLPIIDVPANANNHEWPHMGKEKGTERKVYKFSIVYFILTTIEHTKII